MLNPLQKDASWYAGCYLQYREITELFLELQARKDKINCVSDRLSCCDGNLICQNMIKTWSKEIGHSHDTILKRWHETCTRSYLSKNR